MFTQGGAQAGKVGKGKLTAWSAAHLIQTAAGTGEAYDDGGNEQHKDGQANGDCRSKPAEELVTTNDPHLTAPKGTLLSNTDSKRLPSYVVEICFSPILTQVAGM